MTSFTCSFLLFFIPINFFCVGANWEIIFNDEFASSKVDLTKWEKKFNRGFDLRGELNHFLDRNSRVINGSLAITAIKEKCLTKDFTSGFIETRKGFTYGKFEVRAALPRGDLLFPVITLYSYGKSGSKTLNEIFILANDQDQNLRNEVLYQNKSGKVYNDITSEGKINLNQFNTYVLEWTQTELIWRLNGEQTFHYNLTQRGHPFDRPLKLSMYLSVGGTLFKNKLGKNDVRVWNCPLLIIDYVRIYRWNRTAPKQTQFMENDNLSSTNICSSLKASLNKTISSRSDQPILPRSNSTVLSVTQLTKFSTVSPILSSTNFDTTSIQTIQPSSNNIMLIALICISSALLFISFIPLVIYLFVRMRRIERNVTKQEKGAGNNEYDDLEMIEWNVETDPYYELANPISLSVPDLQGDINYLNMTNTRKYY